MTIKKIDSIKWSKLKHAYGSASDVPKRIEALKSADKTVREQALWKLYGNIFHQGTRYEAAPYAIPYLGVLLEKDEIKAKHEIIYLLVNLAIGYDETYLPKGLNSNEFRRDLVQAETNLSKKEQAMCKKFGAGPSVELACYNTVQEEILKFINCLTDKNDDVRRAASYALAWFPDEVKIISPNLQHQLANELELINIATTIISLGILAHNSLSEIDLDILSEYLSHDSILIKASASISLAINYSQPGKEVFDILINSLVSNEPLTESGQNVPFNEGNFVGLVSLVLASNKGSQEIAIPALCQTLKAVDSYQSIDITQAILQLITEKDAYALKDKNPQLLTPIQRQALLAIADHGGWKMGDGIFVNYGELIRSYGLPDTQEKLYAYLNQTEQRQ